MKLFRIAARVAARTYQGTVDGIRSMLIGKFTAEPGPAAKREAADRVVKEAEKLVFSESDQQLKNAYLNFVVSPLYSKQHPIHSGNEALDHLRRSEELLKKYKNFASGEPSWEKLFPKEKNPTEFKKRNDVMYWAIPDNYAKLEMAIMHAESSGVEAIDEAKFESDLQKLIRSSDFMTLQGLKFTPSVKDLKIREDMSFVVHPHTQWAAEFMGNGAILGIISGPFRRSKSTTCVNDTSLANYHKYKGNIYMIIDGSKDPSKDSDWMHVVCLDEDGQVVELSDSQNNHKELDEVSILNVAGTDLKSIIVKLMGHANTGNKIKRDSEKYEEMFNSGKHEEATKEILESEDRTHITALIQRHYDFTPEQLQAIVESGEYDVIKTLAINHRYYDPKSWVKFMGEPSNNSLALRHLPKEFALDVPEIPRHIFHILNMKNLDDFQVGFMISLVI